MEPDSFFPSEFTNYEYIYNNENDIAQLQVPLSISYFNVPKFANELYTDTDTTYFTYSGDWSSLIVSREKDGRYKNLSMRAYSGDSFKFYFSTGLGFSSGADYYSGPVTISGSYSKLTAYSGEAAAITNAITFLAPSGNSVVFTLPFVENINWIRLHHKSAVSGQAYRLYQFLPRTLIQVDDLEADVIDAVTIRVSESIVIGPNLIGDKTILGQKIVDGTLSGILLTNGTITGNKVQAGTISGVLITAGTIKGSNIEAATISGALITAGTITAAYISGGTITGDKIQVGTVSGVLITNSGITANKLSISQLDAVAANMGTLVVNSGISIGTSGTIWAGAGTALSPQTGLKIYTTSGVSRLTTYANSGEVQVDIASNGKLLAGAGAVTLDSAGLTAGKTVVNSNGITIGDITSLLNNNDALKIMVSGTSGNNGGISFYNGAYSAISPQAAITTDATNSFGMANNSPGGSLILQNAATGNNSIYLYNSNVNIMSTESDRNPGAIWGYRRPAVGSPLLRYYLGHDGFFFRTDGLVDKFVVDADTGNITTNGDIAVSGNIHAGIGDHMFTVNGTTGNLHVGAPPHVFTVNGSSGNTTISGNLSVGPEPHVFKVNSNTGNITVSGTLNVTGATTLTGSLAANAGITVDSTAFTVADTTGNTAIAGTLGVTGQTTLGALNASGAVGFGTSNNKFTVAAATGNTAIAGTLGVTGAITSAEMGYLTVTITATLAITTAGTTIVWQSVIRQANITVASDTITIQNAGYYMFSATFGTVANLTSLRMTLQRGVNYVSTVESEGLSTGGGYIFNFSTGFYATAGSTYKIVLTPSANTTLNFNGEGFAGPTPILNIFQSIGV